MVPLQAADQAEHDRVVREHLARYFEEVVGTDASAEQVAEMAAHPRVRRYTAPADASATTWRWPGPPPTTSGRSASFGLRSTSTRIGSSGSQTQATRTSGQLGPEADDRRSDCTLRD